MKLANLQEARTLQNYGVLVKQLIGDSEKTEILIPRGDYEIAKQQITDAVGKPPNHVWRDGSLEWFYVNKPGDRRGSADVFLDVGEYPQIEENKIVLSVRSY